MPHSLSIYEHDDETKGVLRAARGGQAKRSRRRRTSAMTASPLDQVRGLWGGELPQFYSIDAVTRHGALEQAHAASGSQASISADTETRAGVEHLARVRREEIERTSRSISCRSCEPCSKAYAASRRTSSEPAIASEISVTLRHLRQLTRMDARGNPVLQTRQTEHDPGAGEHEADTALTRPTSRQQHRDFVTCEAQRRAFLGRTCGAPEAVLSRGRSASNGSFAQLIGSFAQLTRRRSAFEVGEARRSGSAPIHNGTEGLDLRSCAG